MKFLQRKRWYRYQSAGLVEESTCGLIFRGALHSLEMWEWVWIIRSSVPLMDERTIGLNDLSNRRGGEVFDQSKSMSLNCARVDYLKRSTCDGGKRSIQCAAVPQTCWRANVPIYLSDVWRNYEWLCPAFLKWSCASTGASLANRAASRRSTAQSINARSNDKRYRQNKSQMTSEFFSKILSLCDAMLSTALANAWAKIANEASRGEMKSRCFRVSAQSECVSTYTLWPS